MTHQQVNVFKNTKEKVDTILQNFNIISKSSSDIGTIPLLSMDIDTGDSPQVSKRPYTLPLIHHEWVNSEIKTLEDAGVICKSFIPWASPIVVVLNKSEKGEPMKRRMDMDFHKINTLQTETLTIERKTKETCHCSHYQK